MREPNHLVTSSLSKVQANGSGALSGYWYVLQVAYGMLNKEIKQTYVNSALNNINMHSSTVFKGEYLPFPAVFERKVSLFLLSDM